MAKFTSETAIKYGKKTQFKAGDKQAKTAKKGSEVSKAKRKEDKELRGYLNTFMKLTPQGSVLNKLESLGVPKESRNYKMAIVIGLANKAVNGDVKAYKAIEEMLGENEKINLEKQKQEKEIELKAAELELRQKEFDLRLKEFEHRLAVEKGEIKKEEKNIILFDLDEFKKYEDSKDE